MYNGPFKWWVQSVMPVVFDDSLSYYEVLAKLTKYIEGLTGDVEQIEKILATIEGIGDVTEFTKFLETIQTEIGNLNDLQTPSKTNLVSAINEIALKADIAYWKPPTGIPENDLSEEVRNKLNKSGEAADYIINNKTLKKAPSNNSPSDLGLGTYSVPDGGIPWNTLSKDVQDRIDAGGGGTGGTKDYTDLINKPQINGHTLNAGDNQSENLGIGTYSKPLLGIPESDLSAEVQQKLNTSGGIADSEIGFVATRDYEAGELIYINGVLYKTKYKILSGTNLIPGNNIEETDISNEIEKINSDIEALQSGSGPDSWSLVTNVSCESASVPTRFFEYFNAIGGENYLFIVTPTITGQGAYVLDVLKRDGTIAHHEQVNADDSTAQKRFTFTPSDTGEYYCTIKPRDISFPVENIRVELEYTESQGISELWTQVNKANQLEPRVGALETLVGEQQAQLDNLDDIPARVTALEGDTAELKDEVTRIEDAIFTEEELGASQKSWTRTGVTAYSNLYFPQRFEEGKKYKVEIDFVAANEVGFYCGTSVGTNSSTNAFVDGGALVGTQWCPADKHSTGFKHTIIFTATGNANYLRFRCNTSIYDFENIFRVTTYDVNNAIDSLIIDVNGLKPKYNATVIDGVNRVIELNNQKKYFNLFFMTDTHADAWDARGAFQAANVVNKTQIADAFLHGGDFTSGGYENVGAYNDIVSDIRINEFVNPKIIVVKGNHENYATTEKNSQFVLMFQNVQNSIVDAVDPDGGYFYIDFPKTKTRIIVLNVWYDATSATETLGVHQLTWLYETALKNLEADYTVLVFAHNIVSSNSTVDTNTMAPLRDLLHAFAAKTTVGDYIFTSSDNGELAGVIVGHAHSDDYNNNSGFNKIVVTRAGDAIDDGYAVDIFTIDTDNHILYETRIGRGDSRAYTYGETNSQITP